MVSAVISDTGGLTTTIYIGDHQEWTNGTPTNYYHHNGRRVAMRTGNDVSFLHADHLQSTTDTTGDDDSGPQLYFPYGETRSDAEVATEYHVHGRRPEAFCSTKRLCRFVRQRWQDALGLYYYNARLVGEWPLGHSLNERAKPFRRRQPQMRRFVQWTRIHAP